MQEHMSGLCHFHANYDTSHNLSVGACDICLRFGTNTAACRRLLFLYTVRMNKTIVNSSVSAPEYFWAECMTDGDDDDDGPSTGLIVLFTTYSFEFLVGVPSNLWMICQIHKKRSEVVGVLPVDFFPLHMALTQLAFFPVVPFLFANHFVWQSNAVLNVQTLLNSMVMIMKPLLHCLVCVERYMAVVRPTDYLRFKGHQYRWGCLGASWSIYILVGSLATLNRSPITACIVLLPVLTIDTFCSLSVLKTLRKPPPGEKLKLHQEKKRKENGNVETHRKSSPGVNTEEGNCVSNSRGEGRKEERVRKVSSDPRVGRKMNSLKRRAFITIIIIQLVLTLNYSPFIILFFMGGQVSAQRIKCHYVPFALAASAGCSYLQPVLYLHRLGRLHHIRKQLVQHLCC